jgi:hypothetical protein
VFLPFKKQHVISTAFSNVTINIVTLLKMMLKTTLNAMASLQILFGKPEIRAG